MKARQTEMKLQIAFGNQWLEIHDARPACKHCGYAHPLKHDTKTGSNHVVIFVYRCPLCDHYSQHPAFCYVQEFGK